MAFLLAFKTSHGLLFAPTILFPLTQAYLAHPMAF
jgi:hypothetical protein